MFYTDEAQRASDDLQVRLSLPSSMPEASQSQHVLVVIGYASSDVLRILRLSYDEVIVFRDGQSIADELHRIAGSEMSKSFPVTSGADVTAAFGELANFDAMRTSTIRRLQRSIEDPQATNAHRLNSEAVEDISRRWSASSAELMDRITEARRTREAESWPSSSDWRSGTTRATRSAVSF